MKADEVMAETISHYRKVTERTTPSDYVTRRVLAKLAERGYYVVKVPVGQTFPPVPLVHMYDEQLDTCWFEPDDF